MKRIQFLSFSLILLCAFTFPDKKVKFEYTFKKGDTYEFMQTGIQNLKQTLPGMGEMTTEIIATGVLTFKIVDLTAEGAKIEAKYTQLKMEFKGPMQIAMDSESTLEDTQNKIVKSMMNKPFFFEITKRGVVEKTENVENVYSGLNTLGLDETTLATAKQVFQQSISEENFKALIETGLINYSQDAVKAGDTWKSISGVTLNFPVQSENTWNLKSIEGNMATINSDGIVSNKDKEREISLPNGLKAKTDLSGKQSSESKVDIKSGWPTETKVLSEIKGKIILLAGSMIPSDMEVPMEIVSESTYTIIKK
jgi:hypothetical protein